MLLNKERALSFMHRSGLGAIVAASPPNVTYIADYHYWLDPVMKRYMSAPGASSDLALVNYALLTAAGEGALIIPSLHQPEAQLSWVSDVRLYGSPGLDESIPAGELPAKARARYDRIGSSRYVTAESALLSTLHDHNLSREHIGLDFEGVRPLARAALSDALREATLVNCSNLLRLIRAVKSAEEIARLRRATEIAEWSATDALSSAAPGDQVSEIVGAFRAGVALRGADFDHLIFGIYGLGVAAQPDYRLRPGDALLVDYGCNYQQYRSDSGLTLTVGDLAAPMRERYETLYECVQVGAAQLKPGTLASEVRGAMRECLAERGITTSHAHGHGLGLEVRDYPIMVENNGLTIKDDCVEVPSDLPLETGMVVNLEAPLYLAGVGSLHLEQTFVVMSTGPEPLAPQDRRQPLLAGGRN